MMKMKTGLFFTGALLLFSAGCKTTETKPVPWKEQSAYLSTVRDPRIYGFNIYQTPAGIEFRDGGRLHPNQIEALPMKADEPFRPVVMTKGKFGMATPVLLDFSTSASWLEYDLAKALDAMPLGEREAQLVKRPGEEIAESLSMVPSMRFKQLYVERPLVNVRMATGPLGPLARGIEKPELKGVIGWETLRKFERIELDYVSGKVTLVTSGAGYMPDPSKLIGKLALVKYAGACAVRGLIDGKEGLVLIDPAGDFEVATEGSAAVSSVQLDADLLFSSPGIAKSTGGVRVGARLLKNYKIVICPQAGAIYFEKPDTGK
ncbi:MAG: hypothetical protein WC334_01200 [Kiritimatiellales bacterium]